MSAVRTLGEITEGIEPTFCARCGSRLALAMSVVEVTTLLAHREIALCGFCTDRLLSWLAPRPNRPA